MNEVTKEQVPGPSATVCKYPNEPVVLKRSIGHLQGLFSVVVGLALTMAITNLIDQTAAVPIRFGALPYFLIYLVTLVPLYHGGLWHLESTYAQTLGNQPHSGALMFDWSLLFVESCGLLALALLITRAEAFSYTFMGLLAFDALWAFVAHLIRREVHEGWCPEQKWAVINVASVVVLTIAMVQLQISTVRPIDKYRCILVATVAVARTIVDYAWCWGQVYST